MSRLKPSLVGFVAVAWLLVCGCAVNPVSGDRELSLLGEEQEVALGSHEHPGILAEYGELDTPALNRYVGGVGQALVRVSHRPHLAYHFTVLDSPILNAFALPGGYIYVTRGLLTELNNEAELAGVVGHEVGHVTARHGAQRYTQVAGYQILKGLAVALQPGLANWTRLSDLGFSAAVSGYGRKNEFQSDRLGLEYAAAVGYDTGQLHHFFETLIRQERDAGKGGFHGLFASHPDTGERILRIRELAAENPGGERVDRDGYLRSIDRIPVGPSADQGLVADGHYLNSRFDIAARLPSGWEVQTARGRVAARAKGRPVGWQAELRAAKPSETSASLMKAWLDKLGGREVTVLPARHPRGAQQLTVQVTSDGKPLTLRITGWVRSNTAMTVLAFGEPQAFRQAERDLHATTASIAPLTAEQRRRAAGSRLQVHRADSGDTFAALAKRYPSDGHDGPWLSYLNGYGGQTRPRAGDLVKVVVPAGG